MTRPGIESTTLRTLAECSTFTLRFATLLKWQSTLSCKQTLELDLIQYFQNIKVFGCFQWLKSIFLGKFLEIWNFACFKKQIVKKNSRKRCGSQRYQRITCITSFQNTNKILYRNSYTHATKNPPYVQGAKVQKNFLKKNLAINDLS